MRQVKLPIRSFHMRVQYKNSQNKNAKFLTAVIVVFGHLHSNQEKLLSIKYKQAKESCFDEQNCICSLLMTNVGLFQQETQKREDQNGRKETYQFGINNG